MVDKAFLIGLPATNSNDFRFALLRLASRDLRKLESSDAAGNSDPAARRRIARLLRHPSLIPALTSGLRSSAVPDRLIAARAIAVLADCGCSPNVEAELIPPLLYALRDDTVEEVQDAVCAALERFVARCDVAERAAQDFRVAQRAELARRVMAVDRAFRRDSRTWRVDALHLLMRWEVSACSAGPLRVAFLAVDDESGAVVPAPASGAVVAELEPPECEFDDSDGVPRSKPVAGERIDAPALAGPAPKRPADPNAETERDWVRNIVLNRMPAGDLRFASEADEHAAGQLLQQHGFVFLCPDGAGPLARTDVTLSVLLPTWADSPEFEVRRRWLPELRMQNPPSVIAAFEEEMAETHHFRTVRAAHRMMPEAGESLIFSSCDGHEDLFGLAYLRQSLDPGADDRDSGCRRFHASLYTFGNVAWIVAGARLRRQISWYDEGRVCRGDHYSEETARVWFPQSLDRVVAVVDSLEEDRRG